MHGPSKELRPDDPRYQECAGIRDLIMAARNKQLLERAFKDRFTWRLTRAMQDLPADERTLRLNEIMNTCIAWLINDTHIDIAGDLCSLIPHYDSPAHARTNWTGKHNYDEKPFGIWIPELFIRTLDLAPRQIAEERLAALYLEEIFHMYVDREIYKNHKYRTTVDDIKSVVEHGSFFAWENSAMTALTINANSHIFDFAQKLRAQNFEALDMKLYTICIDLFYQPGIQKLFRDPTKFNSDDITAQLSDLLITATRPRFADRNALRLFMNTTDEGRKLSLFVSNLTTIFRILFERAPEYRGIGPLGFRNQTGYEWEYELILMRSTGEAANPDGQPVIADLYKLAEMHKSSIKKPE
jgi:hypothetical protein